MIIAFANQKGGVAKTTTCVNLGAGLALRGYSVLLIDADPQASLTRYLGDGQGPQLGDWLMGRSSFDQVLRVSAFKNLSYIASSELLIADQATIEQDRFKGLHYLRTKVAEIHNRFDFVLIDTMPSFTTLFANSIVAADQVLIPVKLEWLSVQGLAPLMEKVREVQQHVKELQVLGVLGTFSRRGVGECQKCLAELEAQLPGHVFKTTIQLNSKVAEASGHGKPIQHYDRQAQGFADYEALTEEVLRKCPTTKKASAAAQ
ncbi:MAG: hypothetical protein A2V88_09300 [Elusimicrobia bacterium RBG_16_66_12]|nr:MAG: hypothetical protein A2V88_09300 [Elusimicrobia bacterium RBG_16_66_12]